jgi:Tfp pilus assembly protein PilX
MRSKINTERGQALVVIALSIVVLFGFAALALDGSAKFSDRRHAQNAADAAALAAAYSKLDPLNISLSNNSPTTGAPTTCPPPTGVLPSPVCAALITAGKDRASSNGYDNNLTTNTVDVYSPPISGYYAGNDSYVQVIIKSDVKTYLARVIGINKTTNTVQAVVYTKPAKNLAQGAMIISYDDNPTCPTGPGNGGGSVDVSGSSTLNLNGGGILINSPIACGYNAPNCPEINITGGAGIGSAAAIDNIDQKDGFCTFPPPYVKPPENLNQEPIDIPEDVYWPEVPTIECGTNPPPNPTKLGEIMAGSPLKLTGEWLIYPGYYEEFPPANLVGNKQIIYMASGIYCIDPKGPSFPTDLSWSPTDFVALYGSTESNPSKINYNKYHTYNPDGITLYIKEGGGFSINSNNPTYLDGSTSGDLQGYLIVLEGTQSSIEDCKITGGANVNIYGLIYAPYCDITIDGQSSPTAEINAQLIGWDIKITGDAVINFNYDPSNQVKIKRRIGLMK